MNINIYDILQDWHELLKNGIITEAEFETKKNELLGKKDNKKNDNQQEQIVSVSIQNVPTKTDIDTEYEILFNKKNWFQKHKVWVISLSAFIFCGVTIWYLVTNSKLDNTHRLNDFENNIDEISMNYIKGLNSSKIQIISEKECDDYEKNLEFYYKDIYRYSISQTDKLISDVNHDGINDYVIYYYAENCWQGNGAGNYLSNMFFITSENNKLKVNENLTEDFKMKFISFINENFGSIGLNKANKEQFINGITYTNLSEGVLIGTFEINTENCQSAIPCYTGHFEYNLEMKTLSIIDVKITTIE